jgi:hypothetical protein
MASEVDIANLALGHLGDNATVASLDPPEGSAQAEHCAQFYPIARDSLLELHAWNFATRRVTLSALTNAWSQWDYAYAKPADCVRVLAVIPSDATDDYSTVTGFSTNGLPLPGGTDVPQPYAVEINDDLSEVILTDQAEATLRYVARITDPTKFSPLFVMALSHHLASMLAGPVIKGDAGAAEGKRQSALAQGYLSRASTSDANQRKIEPTHSVGWMTYR